MSQPIQYSFDDRMKFSDGVSEARNVSEIILGNIPGSLSVTRAHQKNDRNGTDWWVEHETGRHLSIDAKVRGEDWAAKPEPLKADDLALEHWSVVEKGKIGWTRDKSKRCDYVLWLWTDTGRWCMVPFPMLCQVFTHHWAHWIKAYKTSRQFTPEMGGFHSECVFVPRRIVWAEIYKTFSGNPTTRHTPARG